MPINTNAFIADSRAKGMSDDAIRSALLSMGMDISEVNSILSVPGSVTNPQAVGVSSVKDSLMQATGTVSATTIVSPDEKFIGSWSWGGFLLGWVYFLGGGMGARAIGYFFAILLGPIYLVFAIMAGVGGRKKIWQSGKWKDFEAYKKRQKTLDIIGLTFLAAGIIIPTLLVALSSKSPTPSLDNSAPATGLTTTTSATGEDSDIAAAKASFVAMMNAAKNGDAASLRGYVATNDIPTIDGGNFDSSSVANTSLIGAVKDGQNVIISTLDSATNETNDLVFVLENGFWKLSLTETVNRLLGGLQQKMTSTPSGTGKVDLSVESITINPSSPAVGSKDLKVFATVKNIGTKELISPSDSVSGNKVLRYTVKIIYGGGETNIPGTFVGSLLPGKTATFSAEGIFFDLDSAGEQTVIFTFNEDGAVDESSLANNTLSKTFTVVK